MDEDSDITFYYPGMFSMQADGSIVMRATGYDRKGHWTGQHTVRPDAADFRFWQWVIEHRQRWASAQFFSSEELPRIRAEYESAYGAE